jgi:hypothetical protein
MTRFSPPYALADGFGFGHAGGRQRLIAVEAQDLSQQRPHAFEVIYD